MSHEVSRRAFVCGGCAAVAGCQVTHVNVPTQGGSGDTGETGGPTTAPLDYPCGQAVPQGSGRVSVSLTSNPALAQVGGWIAIQAGGRTLVVAQPFEDCFVAMDRACSHEGVPVNYRPERGQFVCPEHGAIYALDGSKVAGPQPTGLSVYPIAREGDTVWIDLS